MKYNSITWLVFMWLISHGMVGYAASDSIPPVIVQPAIDLSVECDNGILDSLTVWHSRYGGLIATDEAAPVELRALLTAAEALQRLEIDQAIQCGVTGSVEVGFFAVDTCGNFSDTSFATFSVIDLNGPNFLRNPDDITVQCSATAEDTLRDWISTFGNAVIDDDCSVTQRFSSYSWTDNEGNSGSGQYGSGPIDITLSNTECNYQLTVSFIAVDECDNQTSQSAVFSLVDNEEPVFESSLPTTITVTCENVPSARSINVTDNCDGTIIPTISDVSTQNADQNTCEHYNYRVDRTYTATDRCGNTTTLSQVIFVADTLEPRYIAPNDTTIRDVAMPDPSISGEPRGAVDNCSSQVLTDYTDDITATGCTLTIERRWNIQDQCGSSLVLTQMITVIDEIPPVANTMATDRTLSCASREDIQLAFSNWVATYGGADVEDESTVISNRFAAVPGSYDINDPSTWPGEHPAGLDNANCPSDRIGLSQYEDVDFVFADACGNVLVQQATFAVADNEAPAVANAPVDTTIVTTDANGCTATYFIQPVEIIDNCSGSEGLSIRTGNVAITGDNDQVPVDNVTLRLGPISTPSFGTDPIPVNIRLSNVDANNPTEFFNIFSETGERLGRTRNTVAQCGSITTTIEVDPVDFAQWAADGFVEFELRPNIISGVPSFSINDVCNGFASAFISLSSSLSYDVIQYVFVDDGQAELLGSGISKELSIGDHSLQYRIVDCANNSIVVSQQVRVIGNTANDMACALDTSVLLPANECMASVTLPAGEVINTTCGMQLTVQDIIVRGATQISSADIDRSDSTFSIMLNAGTNEVVYTLSDDNGANSQCITTVTVVDDQPPMISCAPSAVGRLHPSGILPLLIDTASVLLSMSDNCDIANIEFENTNLSCDFLNQETRFAIKVTDESGNVAQCNSTLRVVPMPIEPIADPVLCFGDTIRLFANAPAIDSMGIYTYNWSGPNGFSSTEANPKIADASVAKSGRYDVIVFGQNGCRSTGSVQVTIRNLSAPFLNASSENLCTGDSLRLSSDDLGANVTYEWYENSISDSNLVQTTTVPFINLLPAAGPHSYILRVSSNVCDQAFAPSEVVSVTVSDRPNFNISDSLIRLCTSDTLRLRATGDTDVDYRWSGPNGFASTQLNPSPEARATPEQSGIYRLFASRGSCTEIDSVQVIIGGNLEKAIIQSDSVYCEGADFIFSIENYDGSSNPGLQYRWLRNGAFFATTLTDSLSIFAATQEAHGGDWEVIVLDGDCDTDTSDIFSVNILAPLDIVIDHPEAVCPTDSISFGLPDIEGATFSWSGPRGFVSTDQNPVAPAVEGLYTVDIQRTGSCIETYSARVRVDQSPIILSLLSNVQQCSDGTSTLVVNASSFPDNDITYLWTGPSGFTSTDERLVITGYRAINNGSYQLTISQGVCPSEPDTFELNVTDVPIAPRIEAVNSVCLGGAARIEVDTTLQSGITSYQWITPNGMFTTSVPFLQLDTVSQDDGGLYFVSAIRGTCVSPLSDTLRLSVFSEPPAPVIESNTPLCMGEELMLKVARQNNTTYEWEGPDGFISTENEITITNATQDIEGNYRVRIYRNGCPSDFTVLESVEFGDSPPPPALETMDMKVCQSNVTDITLCIDRDSLQSGATYHWINKTTERVIGTTTDLCFKVTSMMDFTPGLNTVVARSAIDGCPSADSRAIIIDIFAVPDLTARVGDDIRTCEMDNITISAVQPLRGSGRWRSIDPDIVISNPNEAETQVFGLSEGDNIFIWSLSNGRCDEYSSAQLIVTVVNDIKAVDDDFEIQYNETVPLDIIANDEVSGDQFTVKVTSQPAQGSALYDSVQRMLIYTADPRYVGEVSLMYEVCELQCDDLCSSATVTIRIGDQEACFGPNIITPNGDGINDQVVFPCLSNGARRDNSFTVYNERGDELFSQAPYDNSWAGTYDGKVLPNGTYFYVFDPGNGEDLIKNYLIIQR